MIHLRRTPNHGDGTQAADPPTTTLACPPPSAPAPHHACTVCGGSKQRAPHATIAEAPWLLVSFENHHTKPAQLHEVTLAGTENPIAALAPGQTSYFFSRIGALWRARGAAGEVLVEHSVGPILLGDAAWASWASHSKFGAVDPRRPASNPSDAAAASPAWPRCRRGRVAAVAASPPWPRRRRDLATPRPVYEQVPGLDPEPRPERQRERRGPLPADVMQRI